MMHVTNHGNVQLIEVGMDVKKMRLFGCWFFICFTCSPRSLERFFVAHFDKHIFQMGGKNTPPSCGIVKLLVEHLGIASWNLWEKILCMVGHHQKTRQKLALLHLAISYLLKPPNCEHLNWRNCTIYTVEILNKARYQQWMVWKTSLHANSWWFCVSTLPETNILPLKINGCEMSFLLGPSLCSEDTVDGRNPKQPPGMYRTLVNNGIYIISISTGDRRISEPSTVC